MNLNDFNSSLPKPFLNPQVNNLTANSILTGSLINNLPLQVGSVTNSAGGGTLTLTADQVVGGLLGIQNTTTVNLPSATDIQNFIGALPSGVIFYYFSFKVHVSAGTITFNVGSGMSTYTGSSPFTYSPTNYHDMIFAFTPSGWQVFY